MTLLGLAAEALSVQHGIAQKVLYYKIYVFFAEPLLVMWAEEVIERKFS